MSDRANRSFPWILIAICVGLAIASAFMDDTPDAAVPTATQWTQGFDPVSDDVATVAAILNDVAQAAESGTLTKADAIRVEVYAGLRERLPAASAIHWAEHFMPRLLDHLQGSADKDAAASLADELRQVAKELQDVPTE